MKSPISTFPGYLLRRTAKDAMARLTEILSDFDLSITESSIIVLIQANPNCQQSELGRALNIVSANLTPKLNRLEKRGIIKRARLDGRTNALSLTTEGSSSAKRVLKAMRTFEENLIKELNPITEEDFIAALNRLSSAFSD